MTMHDATIKALKETVLDEDRKPTKIGQRTDGKRTDGRGPKKNLRSSKMNNKKSHALQ